jgi:hypothetical protein
MNADTTTTGFGGKIKDLLTEENITPIRGAKKSKRPEPTTEVKLVDLGPYLEGTIVQEMPTIAKVSDDLALFYKGSVNEIHGEPSVGKTNILVAAVIAEVRAGGSVLYIDPEDTAAGFVSKLRSLSCDDPAVIAAVKEGRIAYLHNPDPAELQAAQGWAIKNKRTLVVLDGLAESLAAEGLNEDVAGDVLSFFKRQVRPFAEEAGAAVVVADHVAKAGNGSWSRGSGAKLGRYDGVSYDVVLGQAYSPKVAGWVQLRVAKDRKGGVGPKGKKVAKLSFAPGNGNGTTTTWEPCAVAEQAGDFRPTGIMDKILDHLRTFETASKRDLRATGKGEYVDKAIKILLDEGKISMTVTKTGGHKFSLASNPLADNGPTTPATFDPKDREDESGEDAMGF